ncbi:hypothetical protein HU200_029641 [Digitaria exilis]|uniref:Protein JASON n=1 Tax=Digitaria exilis TaxID=1010633 RepID=A0A835ERI1_9POAL|nr:hypothetical protein HU200_029641 [Digitaria exilis]
MMGCLFGCFRASAGGGGGREGKGGDDGGQLAHPSVAPATSHEDGAGRRTRPPSRNALAAVFQREDEGSRAEQTASSWADADQSYWKKGMDQELEPQAIIKESCNALLESTNETQREQKSADSVHQRETHSRCLPALSDNVQLMEALMVENSDAMRYANFVTFATDGNIITEEENITTLASEDANLFLYSRMYWLNPFIILGALVHHCSSSKPNDELQSSATSLANNVEDLTMTNESNTEACVQDEEQQVLDLAKDYEECGVSKEEILQPEQSENPSCAKNDNVVSMEISMSDECSLFHSSEGSISSSNKTRDSMKATSMEKPLETEATIHATGKKVLKNNDSEQELPSLSHWLKPPNRKKTFRDDALTGDRSHSAKSSDEDRPIIGMVAAHWKDKEPASFTPKWFDGNGIPNSTNKYKEDQKVSWHATPFEERLEKALSEEKSLSERNCSSGKTSQFLGVEGEESTTAESNRLYAAAYV